MRLPESRYLRRALFGLAALCLLLLALIEYLLLPATGNKVDNLKAVGANVVANLLTSLIAFLVAAGVLLWLFPPVPDAREVKVVSGRDRAAALEEGRRSTTFWWFTGGLGRFNRAVVIPELAAASRQSNSARSIVLLTLDPDCEAVCSTYAELRSARRSGRGQTWTESSVRNEILATILVAFQWRDREPLLEVEVGLKQTCALTRLEINESFAIRTSEDPTESALVFPKEAPFYALMKEDFRLERKQVRSVRAAPLPADIRPDSLRDWFTRLGVNCTGSMSDAGMQEVIDVAASSRSPYG
ncbi:hypothetical protein AB0H57_12105 [Micromonospora sp. NPDC050686]|uniref:hypothetical protein n=1 Tax=Micromonospora sp. NPDC050686 TaxID=3154631 RepID=UPI0033CFFC79